MSLSERLDNMRAEQAAQLSSVERKSPLDEILEDSGYKRLSEAGIIELRNEYSEHLKNLYKYTRGRKLVHRPPFRNKAGNVEIDLDIRQISRPPSHNGSYDSYSGSGLFSTLEDVDLFITASAPADSEDIVLSVYEHSHSRDKYHHAESLPKASWQDREYLESRLASILSGVEFS